MRRSPLFSGLIYLILGALFTYFAIDDVQNNGWGFFSYLLVILATFDFGSALKMIAIHFKYRDKMNKQ
ncbi:MULTISPECIES: YdiK family protein [Neobacillus]|uniref:YdiK family protein n=1 Tax=Neobacillus rhizophilus TaxID=2833579 RepID=A0A942YY38_9BACI|nr:MULTISPECIES: YdiK family protein [Neobacillus]MBS4216674.1 YdiK family protein [Neobacillus rhizophilus]MBU8920124.1 YdiK family protein [Bacillus sp. FJAT-29953]